MTRYALQIIQPDGPPPPPEALARIMADTHAVIADVKSAGAWVFNGGLTPPSSATVVRQRAEGTLMTDGPFVEGKEHVGGLVVIRVDDLDAALAWAKRLSAATTLPIEVRAFHDGG